MKISTKSIISLALTFALILAFAPASFAKTFPSESIEDLKKPWEVTFSQPVDPAYVNSDYVYILDGTKKLDTTIKLLNGGKTIKITPTAAYLAGKSYTLEVAGTIKSTAGVNLADKASKRFGIGDKVSALQSIQYTSAEGFDNFNIITRPDVYKVKINNEELHLISFNEFSRAFMNLKSGSTATIRAYSSTNQILETKKFLID